LDLPVDPEWRFSIRGNEMTDTCTVTWNNAYCCVSKERHDVDCPQEMCRTVFDIKGGVYVSCVLCKQMDLDELEKHPDKGRALRMQHSFFYKNNPQFAWNQLMDSSDVHVWERLSLKSIRDCMAFLLRPEFKKTFVGASQRLASIWSVGTMLPNKTERQKLAMVAFNHRQIIFDVQVPRVPIVVDQLSPVASTERALQTVRTIQRDTPLEPPFSEIVKKEYTWMKETFPAVYARFSGVNATDIYFHNRMSYICLGTGLVSTDASFSEVSHSMETQIHKASRKARVQLFREEGLERTTEHTYMVPSDQFSEHMQAWGIPYQNGVVNVFQQNIQVNQTIVNFNGSDSDPVVDVWQLMKHIDWKRSINGVPGFGDEILTWAVAINKHTPSHLTLLGVYYLFNPENPHMCVAYDKQHETFYEWNAAFNMWKPFEDTSRMVVPLVECLRRRLNEMKAYLTEEDSELYTLLDNFFFEIDVRTELFRNICREIGNHINKYVCETLKQPHWLDTMMFNTKLGKLRTANGIFNLATGEMEPNTRNWFDTRCIPWTIVDITQTQEAEAYLEEMFCNQDDRDLQWKEIDYFLYRVVKRWINDDKDRIIYWMQGPYGSCKSTLVDIIKDAIGPHWFYAFPDGVLNSTKKSGPSPEMYHMRDVGVTSANEGITHSITDIQTLNAITGWDSFNVRLMRSNRMVGMPFKASVLMQSNELDIAVKMMTYKSLDDRIAIQIFERKYIKKNEWKDAVHGQAPKKYALRVGDIREKYPHLVEQMAHLLLRKAAYWYQNNIQLTVPDSMEAYKRAVFVQVNPVHMFLDKYCHPLVKRHYGENTTLLFKYFECVLEAEGIVPNKKETQMSFKKKLDDLMADTRYNYPYKYSSRDVLSECLVQTVDPALRRPSAGYLGLTIHPDELGKETPSYHAFMAYLATFKK
jgi:hypothetical protein